MGGTRCNHVPLGFCSVQGNNPKAKQIADDPYLCTPNDLCFEASSPRLRCVCKPCKMPKLAAFTHAFVPKHRMDQQPRMAVDGEAECICAMYPCNKPAASIPGTHASADGCRQERNVPQLGKAFTLASEYINLWKMTARLSLEMKLIHFCSPALGIK